MRPLLLAALITFAASPALAQDLKVTVQGRDSLVLTPADLQALPRAKATFTAHGKPITYEGALLNAALKQAGVVSGDRLMGRYLNQVVVAKGSDGFTASYSLGETDPIYRTNPVIIADRKDGQPLDAKEGPYRLVVDGDLRPGRSVRMLTSVEVKAVQ
ncbi:molybdopterin-dependent oxidoreductase [Caulobacter sp. BK020]|uniref:molybdopterin-dependent oxidoreductase n=1 Tax=Caulobacter sp. BK020 TaxID=2512117 RepID=UPI001043B29C|nr:molybdopterin-dependent oxidoreductase [Caulobacter sp. BK020]TCS12291.1 molybdopterin-dependent oxidoreductase-like protein [Caulobacter sp. BK020]